MNPHLSGTGRPISVDYEFTNCSICLCGSRQIGRYLPPSIVRIPNSELRIVAPHPTLPSKSVSDGGLGEGVLPPLKSGGLLRRTAKGQEGKNYSCIGHPITAPSSALRTIFAYNCINPSWTFGFSGCQCARRRRSSSSVISTLSVRLGMSM